VNFSGKKITDIPRTPGWGLQHGWSADAQRMLFDHFTTSRPFLEHVVDSVASVLVPVPEESNGERITVVDTATGRICFHVEGKKVQFGSAGETHADISPSGQFVGIATPSTLTIYAMPVTCSAR
jgi:hypothetical protein